MKQLLVLIFIIVLIPVHSYAERTPGPKARQAGDLALIVTASESLNYIKDWVSTSHDKPITIKRLYQIKPDQVAYCAFLVTGMSPDVKGMYAFVVHFKLKDPTGKILFDMPSYAKGNGPYPNIPTFIMANPALDLILEQSDPAGLYLIEATVEDLVTGKKAYDKYMIELKK